MSTLDLALRETQTQFYGLDLSAQDREFSVNDSFNLLRLNLKDADEDEEVFKVPGGDFEDVLWPVMADKTRTYDPASRFSFASNCVFQAVRGWTFFQPEGFKGDKIPAEIGLAFPAMQEKASHPSRYCNSGEIRYGENVLTLVCADAGNPGYALAGPFRAPAGRI